jgi:hypothetical protein
MIWIYKTSTDESVWRDALRDVQPLFGSPQMVAIEEDFPGTFTFDP